MKILILFFAFASMVSSISAFADGSLHGPDAVKMANVLQSSGFHEIWDVTVGYVSVQDVSCIGENYVDRCQARAADSRPPAPLAAISSGSAAELWSLLKRAGVRQITRNGDSSIQAARIDCTLTSYDESQDVCSIQ